MQEKIVIKAIFVSSFSGEKNGKKYNVLSLSNGLRTATAFLDEPIETEGLKEGDEVEVEMTATINFKNSWDIKPIRIEKV